VKVSPNNLLARLTAAAALAGARSMPEPRGSPFLSSNPGRGRYRSDLRRPRAGGGPPYDGGVRAPSREGPTPLPRKSGRRKVRGRRTGNPKLNLVPMPSRRSEDVDPQETLRWWLARRPDPFEHRYGITRRGIGLQGCAGKRPDLKAAPQETELGDQMQDLTLRLPAPTSRRRRNRIQEGVEFGTRLVRSRSPRNRSSRSSRMSVPELFRILRRAFFASFSRGIGARSGVGSWTAPENS
jgi:hypothetical protein